MTKDERRDYFEWLCDRVKVDNDFALISFNKLLGILFDIEFVWILPMDKNRAEDGISLRNRYYKSNYDDISPCSILEMMVALAIKCENLMDDPSIGDRTGQWFWGMIVSLGLGSMDDDRFDYNYVEDVVVRFINRDYEPNGKGGLFTLNHSDQDLRRAEIWHQLCWYLDEHI